MEEVGMAKILKEKIISVEEIGPEVFKMTIESGYVSEKASPGQFVNVKCGDGSNPLLRRPISICDVDRKAGTFDLVFQVRGSGTGILSTKKPGDEIDMIAPLGRGFGIPEGAKKIGVVGGGIGIFPLLFLLKERKAIAAKENEPLESIAFLGFRNAENIILQREFEKVADRLLISTDDGSEGYHGFITDLLERELERTKLDVVYTCGPKPMMKRVIKIAAERNIRCQVSLEERMGCGIGACLVCACKTKLGDGWEYSHVCKDGPVFWSDEVMLE